MEIIGYTESVTLADGSIFRSIRAILSPEMGEQFVPDDMANSDRYRIWDEWEMSEPDEVTGERVRVNTIPEYVPPPPLPPAPYTLQMSDFWVRFEDDEEYEAFNDAVAIAPLAKDRRAFGAAMFLVSNNPLFTWTRNVLVGAIGDERADVIMAPSTAARSSSDETA